MEIEITPESGSYDPQDDRWLDQVTVLYDDLRENGIPLREESTPVPGAKGGGEIATVIAAMGSAGAFTAAVTIFKAWLSRERTRRLRIKWNAHGEPQEVSITADTDDATLERITREAMKQAAEA
jgi:hypothetical protein